MADVKITDLVPQETIDQVKRLDSEINKLYDDYAKTAMDMAKGLELKVKVIGDIDKLQNLHIEKTTQAAEIAKKINAAMAEQQQVLANTTNTIQRHLAEQERSNKAQREAYTEHERVKKLLDQYNDTYENQTKSLAKIKIKLDENKKAQKDNEKALASGRMSMDQFTAKQAELIATHRSLTQEKRTLTQIMTAEEKAAQSDETSYVHMSQQLELLKKAWKDLSEEGRNADFGQELESTIQGLDAHLKDLAADMGEFQRNVGNYAIAGKDGVVTTDSVVAALNQEARTTQDLIDQTKILEEAKLMLNKNDANYQATVDSLNAKLEENKRKLTDVSDILGKEARSVSEAEAQNKRLSEAMKHIDLASADAKKRLEEMRSQIERNNQIIASATGQNEKFADSVLNIIGVNANFGSSFQSLGKNGNFIEGLNTKVKAFGQTLMGLLSNPWVLAFLGIAGVVAGFKWWYDYNKGLIEASRLTQNFTGLTGEAADKITTDTQAIADHMGKGFDDTIGAANTLVQQFGISWEEALLKIEDGIQAGADMNGRFIENINQFAPALRDAGVSVDEFVSILAETRNGIFDEKGVQDIIKGGTRLRAMTKQIADSLDACGISSKQMQKDLEEGNITMLDAVQQVSAKLKELPENSQEAGQVMKNVFGRTAAEGGTLLIQSLADVNTNLDVAKERMGNLGKLNIEQMEAQKELNEMLASVFKASGTSFEEMTVSAKTYIIQGLTGIIKGCVDIVNWFIRMYNKSIAVRGAVNSIASTFKIMWEIAKFILKQLVDSFKATGTVIEGVVTLDWEKVKEGWSMGMNALKGNVETMAKNIASSVATAYNNTLKDEMQEISIGNNANLTGVGARNSADTTRKKPQGIETEAEKKAREKAAAKAAKEAEKNAKEELKRINELEEAKISVMADVHEKELAQIRLKFKKKIDEIRGNGDTEIALRVQLAAQCEKEVAECELRYQSELSKINLDNRLASVEKGSEEELTLKLAKLEAARAAELKEAEKTGADVTFINAKYDKERLELQEEHAANMADLIEKQYADENDTAETQFILEMAALQKEHNKRLAAAKGYQSKMEKAEEDFQKKCDKLNKKHAIQRAKDVVEMYKKMLETANLPENLIEDLQRKLERAKAELDKLEAEMNQSTNDWNFIDPEFIKDFEKWGNLALEVFSAVNDAMQAYYDNQISKIEELQEANEAAGEAEQERIADLVEKKVISEEEGEARKRAAEAKTAKQNEEFEKKKQKLKHKQAIWDKTYSISQATMSTALAVMNALNTKPFMLGLALAAIASAMGAAQIATIVATPIPAYAKGTDSHPGGPAIVGDGGRHELVLFDNSAWITPDRPTLCEIPAGAAVIPDIITYGNIAGPVLDMPSELIERPAPKPYDDTEIRRGLSEVRRGVSEVANLLRAQIKQQHADAYDAQYELFKSKI
jgi:hypothetical protein|nr:MAG TPA: chromosome segregation protein [Caudoviricetes sp.]